MQNNPSLGEFMVLGTLEVLLNQTLTLHPQGSTALDRLAGKVIRIRAYDPDYICYCLIERDGVELATGFDGDADIRVRGSAGALIYRALLPPGEAPADDTAGDIQIDGDADAVAALREVLDTFNLWEAVRTWLREHVAMPEVLGLLRRHDPAWLERLQDLPQTVGQVLEEVRRQALVQQQILDELQALRTSLRAERRTDLFVITVATILLALALMTATGKLPVFNFTDAADQEQAWVLAVLGLALLLSRLFRRRYA
ncbi:MAG: hypothetical protein ACOY3X_05110 [Pseudomonadota bacterium]